MKYVWAYERRTGRKRRIPEKWLQPNVFGDAWSLTPRSRGYKAAAPVDPEPTSSEAAPDPAQPEPRKDK